MVVNGIGIGIVTESHAWGVKHCLVGVPVIHGDLIGILVNGIVMTYNGGIELFERQIDALTFEVPLGISKKSVRVCVLVFQGYDSITGECRRSGTAVYKSPYGYLI